MVHTMLTAADGGPQAHRWYGLAAAAGLAEDQEDRVAAALLVEHVRQVDALLPDGCTWHLYPGTIRHPVGAAGSEELVAGIITMAAELVAARYDQIARWALADFGPRG